VLFQQIEQTQSPHLAPGGGFCLSHMAGVVTPRRRLRCGAPPLVQQE
jgi:hypothetical protein